MNAPVTRRALLGATAVAGAMALPTLAEAAVDAPAPAHPDAELFRLLGAWGPLRAEADAAGERSEALWIAFDGVEPEKPAALRVRTADGFNVSQGEYRTPDGRRQWWYEIRTRDDLHALAPPDCSVLRDGRWVTVPDEARIARRAEILAALDAWWAECDVVKARLGMPAADEAEERACKALWAVERGILEAVPATWAGLVAKVRHAARPELPRATAERWRQRVAADVLAMAERDGAAS